MKVSEGATSGRPRIAAIDASLAAAFEELIAEIPLRDFSVRALVSRAGTTRDAFYRRYASLGHFFIEMVLGRFATDPTEDTGALAGDLLVIVRAQRAMYDDPLAAGLLPLILDASFRDPVTAESLSARFIQRQRVAALAVLERAVARGEIGPIADPQFVIDQLYSPMLFRAVLPGMPPIDAAYEQAIVISVLTGLGVAHPGGRLATALEESERRKTGSSGGA